jgi:hypothetical protein
MYQAKNAGILQDPDTEQNFARQFSSLTLLMRHVLADFLRERSYNSARGL